MKMLRLALPCALMLGLSACSTTPALRAPDDYPRLSVKANEPNTLVFVKPGIDAASAFGRWSAAEKVLENAAERLATDLDRP